MEPLRLYWFIVMSHVEEALTKAGELEKRYGWLKAAELYGQALSVVEEEDFLKRGEIQGKIGFCFYWAALQADKQDAFNRHIRKAIKAYETASSAFASLSSPANHASGMRCKALALYCALYLLKEAHEIRKGLYAILELQKRAFKMYKNCGNSAGKMAQCQDLLQTINDLLEYEETKDKRVELIDLGLAYSEEAIQACLDLKNERDLADVYLKASELCGAGSGIFADENQRVTCEKKQEEYLRNALELSERTGDWITRVKVVISHGSWRGVRSAGEAAPVYLTNMQDLLEDCRKVRIREVTTGIINGIMYGLLHQLVSATDRDKADEIFATVKKYGDESARLNSVTAGILRARELGITYWCLGISYRYYGLLFENDPKARIRLLDKGIEITRKIPSHTSPVGRMGFLSTYSYHLNARASIERNAADRKKLLLEALDVANQWIKSIENLHPYFYRLIADHLLVYSSIRAKLALMETSDTRIKMLHEACEYSKKGIKYLATGILDKSLRIRIADSLLELGRIQFELFQATVNHDFLTESFLTLEKAARTYSAEGLYVRTAEAFWSLAKMQDAAEQFQEASESFELASENYRLVAVKISQLKDFYSDYASYMDAWSEVERAKHNHEREEYSRSKEHYEKAATILQSSRSWNHLNPNYSAWSQLEHAEDLSRKEQSQESIQAFQAAAKLFGEAKKALQTVYERIESLEEKEKTNELVRASNQRKQYCLGRIILEEARLHDREGDYESSAKKYGSAAGAFKEIVKFTEAELDRRDLLSTIYLCKAWQKMKVAEETGEPALYADASELFMKSKESSLKKRTSFLAAGNSYFCKALEFGARFKATRDLELYYKAKQFMESASDCYTDAGFEKESAWVSATQVLFDAYVYAEKAETEIDPGKKTKLYQMAEQCLQASAQFYTESGHMGKKIEVLKHLNKVKKKREFALSLAEVLKAPLLMSSTASISALTPTSEEAVGLERFEHADIQANLILKAKHVKVGEDINLEIELVNAGKAPASLIKIDKIIPEDFEVKRAPKIYRVEDRYLNMKGRRLAPLKTEEIRLVLRSAAEGIFILKPRIMYLDETGKYKSHEPEPVTIEVYEVLPDRITTGCRDFDNLLFGGIPRSYAVILTSPSCDERELLIKRFLEAGAEEGQITFHVAIEASGVKTLVEEFQSNFYLFICNPQADKIIKSLPNVFKLKGVENLTEISIALTSAFRRLDASFKGPRRACIEIISDVLLQHHAVHTRRWLTGLIPELKSRGFTTLAVMNPSMHPSEEVQAIQDLFEGEISIYEKQTKKGSEKYLRIEKMYHQRYLESELPLKKERLRR